MLTRSSCFTAPIALSLIFRLSSHKSIPPNSFPDILGGEFFFGMPRTFASNSS